MKIEKGFILNKFVRLNGRERKVIRKIMTLIEIYASMNIESVSSGKSAFFFSLNFMTFALDFWQKVNNYLASLFMKNASQSTMY